MSKPTVETAVSNTTTITLSKTVTPQTSPSSEFIYNLKPSQSVNISQVSSTVSTLSTSPTLAYSTTATSGTKSTTRTTIENTSETASRAIDTMKDWYSTPIAKRKGKERYTGSWPSTYELPKDQRRDTACPYTYRNQTRNRIKKWPNIIGIGAPKCGTGTL